MNKKSQLYLVFAAICLIISISFLTYYSKTHKKELFPADYPCKIFTYTDEEDPLKKGSSSIVAFSVDSTIYLSTVIGDAIKYPYAGFRIQLPDSAPFIDISGYDRLDIEIDSTNATFFIIDYTTYIEGYTDFCDYMSFRHHTEEIFIPAKPQTLKINMADVGTQMWWYDLRNMPEEKLPEPDYSRCHTISFEINAVKPDGAPLFMAISSMALVNTNGAWLIAGIITGGISLVLLLLGGITKRVKIREFTPISGKRVSLNSVKEEELERLCLYISENYHEPELTISQVSKEAGIGTDKISQLLMAAHNMQYKQYLNTIRITEAQRLLCESDRQISEIAIAIGYNYPTTFNRIFKESTGISPGRYRKESMSRNA